ncbi:hypothetical protein [Bacillus sp. ISL-57]|uniref:hypothetical protein n=1 Tax=Bacillus sp. ISL-57 TaxID=2819135 RepID=UPI001BECD97B|nr:hypothetical protein [Bacillus sp. ISL-57]MBT2716596.1 hypothetical protein [Bacillus sp. ISL-57]
MDFKYEFFKEQYDKQQELKESLNNRFTIIMTIVPLLFTGIFFCFKNINDLEKYPFWYYELINFGFISLILDVIIIVLLMRHFKGEVYEIFQQPSEWERVYKEYETYENNQPNPDVENDFKAFLCEEYSRISNHNWNVNDKRRESLNLAHNFIIASLITTLISVGCYIPSFFGDDANTQKVEITKTPKINLKEVPDVKSTEK